MAPKVTPVTSPDAEAAATAAPRPPPVRHPDRPLAACTIISRNYLSQARVLAESYFRHEPKGRFYTLVVDGLPPGADAGPGVRVVGPADLGLPNLHEWCFKYDVVELNTAVKPAFLSMLLSRFEEEVVYLDPDILVARPLQPVKEALAAADIVLTPHILSPLPLDGLHPSDQDILVSGAFNLGFVALRRSAQAEAMLKWWGERLEDHCRIDVAHGLFTDQRWVDLVPGFFPATAVLRDDTCNVAFWNLHEREVTRRGDEYLINGRPLTFFHFSGFNPAKRLTLSKHQDRVRVVPGTPLADLLDLYADLHAAAGHATTGTWEYGWSRFDNGARVSMAMRQLYLGLDRETRAWFGNPFVAGGDRGDNSFLDWATRPCPTDANLSRLLRTVYHMRPDVAAAFPDVTGKDRARFVEWATNQAPGEMGFEREQVRVEPPAGPGGYGELVHALRRLVDAVLPPGARVAVANKGDDALLDLGGGRTALHFPPGEDGRYLGYNPADGAAAVDYLDEVREEGVQFLVLPATAFWWLEHYKDFRRHLQGQWREVPLPREDVCLIYDLRPRDAAGRLVRPAAGEGGGGVGANGNGVSSGNGTGQAWQDKQAWYRRIVRDTRRAVRAAVPAGATVVVVTKGDDALLHLEGRTGWHFPQTVGGAYAGHNPADSAAAIAHLEAVRAAGGQFLVFPATSGWWLDHYASFRRHLDGRYTRVGNGSACVIYRLVPADDGAPADGATRAEGEAVNR